MENADWTHAAFPCKSFTRARRTDQFGTVEPVRSESHPEGWGHPLAEFSLENPGNSFAWLVKVVQQLQKYSKADLTELDQRAYGAKTVKPTGILGTAPWMSQVNLKCHQVRLHRHRDGGFVGFVWDPLVGLENFESCRVPLWTLLGLGYQTEGMDFVVRRSVVTSEEGKQQQCLGVAGQCLEAGGLAARGSAHWVAKFLSRRNFSSEERKGERGVGGRSS